MKPLFWSQKRTCLIKAGGFSDEFSRAKVPAASHGGVTGKFRPGATVWFQKGEK